ncbi:MAG TPA: dTDP-4-amino-4,6-dideoxygalactose transaminase [Acidobacteriota bacterium]|nr:dTDP-4-amino-4,6-dideoxygalactose transaminase [Acidobacteriota bacterium]
MMTRYSIPFNRPFITGEEQSYILQALHDGRLSGDGRFTARCHSLLEETLGVRKVLLTTSGTHALEMAALLLELRPGNEVVVPSFTFTSTANAFVLHGGRPVFADIRKDTLNIDESKIEPLINTNTKAIVVVHYAGVGCEMESISRIAARHTIPVIEDNAHGLFAKYNGQYLGTFGPTAALSFHETKNFTCGEGGALIINEPELIERAEIIREKGTNRSRFFRGETDKYSWVDTGSSYLPSELLAAVLLAQLEARERIQGMRRRIWKAYQEQLSDWAMERAVGMPVVPPHCEQSFHMFYLLMPSPQQRDVTIARLKSKGILSVFHYLPLHLSDMGRRLGGKPGDCPVTESVSERLLRLPFYSGLTEEEQGRVVSALKDCL